MCPSDVIWQQGSRSTFAQVMACCLTAPSHYLNQCWLMISGVLWHSADSNFTENTQDVYFWNELEIYKFETNQTLPRCQWVKRMVQISLATGIKLLMLQLSSGYIFVCWHSYMLTAFVGSHMEAWTKWLTFCRLHFQMHHERKCEYFDLNVHWSLFLMVQLLINRPLFRLWQSCPGPMLTKILGAI